MTRLITLSMLVLTGGVMIALAGPPVLTSAQGSPISVRGANHVSVNGRIAR